MKVVNGVWWPSTGSRGQRTRSETAVPTTATPQATSWARGFSCILTSQGRRDPHRGNDHDREASPGPVELARYQEGLERQPDLPGGSEGQEVDRKRCARPRRRATREAINRSSA